MAKYDIDNLTFDNLYDYVNEDYYEQVLRIYNQRLYKPWLVEILLWTLSDCNSGLTLNDSDAIQNVVNLLVRFHKSSMVTIMGICSDEIDIEKLVEYTQQDRYMIDAANGNRVATINEVEEAIYKVVADNTIEIYNDPEYKLEESEYKFINMLAWTLTGKWRYYIRAGYTVEFVNGDIKGTDYKYIAKVYNVIGRMCELFDSGSYCDDIIEKLQKIKKLGKYKYPNYADDEVETDEKMSFIINQLPKLMPQWKTNTVFKCSTILKKYGNSNINKIPTEDKLTLRRGYFELKNPSKVSQNIDINDSESATKLKNMCDEIRKGASDGAISSNDLALKIAFSLSKCGYNKCSDKQMNVLNIALDKINRAKEKNARVEEVNKIVENIPEKTEDTSEVFSIANMSNLLGKGLMGDGTI